MNITQLDKVIEKAVKSTNLCSKHFLYHGQKYKSCTPQERVVIKFKSAS